VSAANADRTISKERTARSTEQGGPHPRRLKDTGVLYAPRRCRHNRTGGKTRVILAKFRSYPKMLDRSCKNPTVVKEPSRVRLKRTYRCGRVPESML
jgi:hypothetical protein